MVCLVIMKYNIYISMYEIFIVFYIYLVVRIYIYILGKGVDFWFVVEWICFV